MTKRIDDTFARLKSENKAGFVAYFMGGDPDFETSLAIMKGLPGAGADIIELGMPFTDPAADGPVIEDAGLRSLKAGTTVRDVLSMAASFRENDTETPIILMGYANPVHHMGYAEFAQAAKTAGVDGAIIVDLPPEEDGELRAAFDVHDPALIRLATPTTDDARLPRVLTNTSGFVYYVSITGITGAAEASATDVGPEVARIKSATDLPVIVGFGINTPEKSQAIASVADGVVVGSAIVAKIGAGAAPKDVLAFVKSLADGAHSA